MQDMTYKGITILANCREYSQWTLDENGRPLYHHYTFEGADIISYTTDEQPDVEFDTLDGLKRDIDIHLARYKTEQGYREF